MEITVITSDQCSMPLRPAPTLPLCKTGCRRGKKASDSSFLASLISFMRKRILPGLLTYTWAPQSTLAEDSLPCQLLDCYYIFTQCIRFPFEDTPCSHLKKNYWEEKKHLISSSLSLTNAIYTIQFQNGDGVSGSQALEVLQEFHMEIKVHPGQVNYPLPLINSIF